MKAYIKNAGNDEIVYGVIRMTEKEHKALYEYMHCNGEFIEFPYGAFVTSRGCGWYRINSIRDKRATDQIKFALECIRRFLRDAEAAVVETIKTYAPLITPETACMAIPPKPASASKLNALLNKFSHSS